MSYDPFAAAPAAAPEPVAAPAPAPVAAAPAPVVSTGSNNEIVVTLKGGAGFDAPWIVIHAPTVAEADAILGAELASLMEKVKKAGQHFSGGAAPAAAPAQAAAPSYGAPAGATAIPADAGESPGPGWEYKTGVSKKNGQTWRAWMPPKGSNEQPKFLRG